MVAEVVDAVPDGRLEFRLPDPDRRYRTVRLDAGLGTGAPRPELTWSDGVWSVQVALPPLHRVEYGFEVTHTIADPGNAHAVDCGFGLRSVIEMPGYRAPEWTTRTAPAGTASDIATGIDGVTATLWSPDGLQEGDRAPLVVVHDGPDYADRGALTLYLGLRAAAGSPARALLLSATPREQLYAADDDYAAALVTLLDTVTSAVPTSIRIAVGASLGALAALHAQWRHPGTFDGLLLQSGSFFTPDTDGQESSFCGWAAVTDFMAHVHTNEPEAQLPPIAVSCGAHEENATNNARLAQRLAELGALASHTEIDDLHNFTCWRDTLDPALADLLG